MFCTVITINVLFFLIFPFIRSVTANNNVLVVVVFDVKVTVEDYYVGKVSALVILANVSVLSEVYRDALINLSCKYYFDLLVL